MLSHLFGVSALSNVDCFHPSLKTHRLFAAGMWNRLVGDAEEKEEVFAWTETLEFRCLEEGDRISTKTLL